MARPLHWMISTPILSLIFCQADAAVVTHYDRLQRKLLEGYEGTLPSVNNTPVSLGVLLVLLQIHHLDGQSQTLTISAQIGIMWTDPHFTWERDEYGGIEMTSLSAEKVWLPHIGIINSADQVWDDNWKKVSPLLIFEDGMVYWHVSSTLKTSCELDMSAFPYDSQHCHIHLGALVDSTDHMDMEAINDTIHTEFLTPSKEWELISTSAERVVRFSKHRASYKMPGIEFHLVLSRKPTFYVITLLIPSMLLSLLTPVVFTIPSDAGEKLSFSITVLLSFSVFLIILADNTPRTSEHVPLLGIYLSVIIVITGLSLVSTVIILNVNFVDPLRPMPNWLYNTVVIRLGTVLCMRDKNISPRSLGNRIADKSEEDGNTRSTNHTNSKITLDKQDTVAPGLESVRSLLKEIKSDICKIASQMDESKDEKKIRDRWKLAARILDRFFLVIYLIVVVGTLFGMLVIYPQYLAVTS